ncbi:osmotically activated L-carnitine/choline ABC transporter [Desulfocucumis palustris]|uniref:Osmotically activated L-carnitine/choline ABC transporter n=1 Tax=Desulfocucumis palustris TaxID=1898651 RepID=A0A2L2XA93_9FIRM|nr:ABC transporter permease [Desulfocucumis palustris]GBF32553.1 osmotically activated L-carnitine/choline ABC transporter [Desulfocucumis palustris]
MYNILALTLQHLWLSAAGVLIACLVGMPLAVVLLRYRVLAGPVMAVIDAFQTIPSLAMLAILMYYLGLGNTTLIVALFIYALLPVVRNTYVGLDGVNRELLEAGKGMGMTRWQILRLVRIPIALPVILAGFRVAIVTSIGIATVGTLIGAGGLGDPIWRGIQLSDTALILWGAVPAAVMAVLSDILLGRLEKTVIPRGMRVKIAD